MPLKFGKVETRKLIIKLSKRKDVHEILKTKFSFKKVNLTDTGIAPNTPTYTN